MNRDEYTKEEIKRAAEVIKNGGVILYPTDTVWGLGCDATNEKAVARIYQIKKREENKSMILLLDEAFKLNLYVNEVPAVAWDWIELEEKPITIVYEGAKNLAPNVINKEDGSVAIRVVRDDVFCKGLIRKVAKPIVSTSANISGEEVPQSFRDIDDEILKQVDYVVNLRRQELIQQKPSTIVKINARGIFKFIRK